LKEISKKVQKNPHKSPVHLVACFPEESRQYFHSGKLDFVFGLPWNSWRESPMPVVAVQLWSCTSSKNHKWIICPSPLEYAFLSTQWSGTSFQVVPFHQHFAFNHIFQAAKDSFSHIFHTSLEYIRFFKLEFIQITETLKFMLYTFVGLVGEEKLHTRSPPPAFKLVSNDQIQKHLSPNSGFSSSFGVQLWSDLLQSGMIQSIVKESLRGQQVHSSANPWSIGLFIGRFQPFHNGHLQVILDILQKVSFLKIGIGSCQYHHQMTNPFTWEERREMIRLALNEAHIPEDRYEISPLQDDHHIYKWLDRVLHQFGEFQVYFANNEWTRQLVLHAGKEAYPLQKYSFESWNGSHIRGVLQNNRPIHDFVPSAVAQYLGSINAQKRIHEK
jgi:nicotinamide-nucleotide adenylyltransferase